MPIDPSRFISARSLRRRPSAIRALVPYTNMPGVLSLSGGNPNPSMFPLRSLSLSVEMPDGKSVEEVAFSTDLINAAQQYTNTQGFPPLLNVLSQFTERFLKPKVPCQTITGSGSQDLLGKTFEAILDPGDVILVENPAYPGVLAALQPYAVDVVGVDSCPTNGIKPESLDAAARHLRAQGRKVKAVYYVATGGNPTGATVPASAREALYAVAKANDLLILEDDPYALLHYDAVEVEGGAIAAAQPGAAHPLEGSRGPFARRPSALSFDDDGRVIRFDSVSKVISAGFRVGWATGPAWLIERLVLDGQSGCIHTSALSQAVVSEVLRKWTLNGLLARSVTTSTFYKKQCEAFGRAADAHLSDIAEWSLPSAGMFGWLKLRNGADVSSVIPSLCADHKVVLVPGKAFAPPLVFTEAGGKGAVVPSGPSSHVRAAFSTCDEAALMEACKRARGLLLAAKAE